MAIPSALITGGTGFVGSAIIEALIKKHPECSITSLDINPPKFIPASKQGVAFVQADVTNLDDVTGAIADASPSLVIHTAGLVPSLAERYGRQSKDLVHRINVEGTRNVMQAAQDAGVQAFVYTSSCCSVTDDFSFPYAHIDERWPTSRASLIYGESKAEAESIVLPASNEKFLTCVLRPSVLCGPGDYQLIPSIHACIAKGETPYVIGDGLNLWDVTDVRNIAHAHVLAAENLFSTKTAAGEAFFIQNNEPITFRDFCLAIWAQFGHVPPFEVHIPLNLAWMAGMVAECFTWFSGGTTTLSRGSVRDACSMRYASGEKARRILGYEAQIGIEDAIREGCEDYARRRNTHLPKKARPGKYNNVEISSGQSQSLVQAEGRNGASNGAAAAS